MLTEIRNESEMLEQLIGDIRSNDREQVLIIAGHFPLIYDKQEGTVKEGLDRWGKFSLYSWELGCYAAKEAIRQEKDVKLLLVCDDHSLLPAGSTAQRLRRGLYRKRAGKQGVLPSQMTEIMQSYEISLHDIQRHDHGKRGREDCLYFSENILRDTCSRIENLCAREYFALLADHIDKEKTQLVGFIPQRCRDNICHYALDDIEGLESSHFFIPTGTLTIPEMYGDGRALHRRD